MESVRIRKNKNRRNACGNARWKKNPEGHLEIEV